MIIIRNVYLFGYAGFSFFIFLFFADRSPSKYLINHERIHFYQQVELLFVLHWILYLLNYILRLIPLLLRRSHSVRKCHDLAYRAICFEREAYENDSNLEYLHNRRPYAWIKFL